MAIPARQWTTFGINRGSSYIYTQGWNPQDYKRFYGFKTKNRKMNDFDLRKYLAENKLLKEDKGINYLKKAFEIYLEGGDDFNKEVGETETVKFENDESLIDEEEFKVALQSLPTTVKVDAYNVNFKKVGDNIVGTFKIK